jgi:serine/threonine protein kinase
MPTAICTTCFESAVSAGVCGACGAKQAEPNRDRRAMPAGTMVADKYRIGRVLGSGGFGITYLAQDVQLARRVALKEFLPSGLGTRGADKTTLTWNTANDEAPFQKGLHKFFKEGQVLAKFNHPNIVRVQEVIRANGTAYLAMEYLEGLTLGEWLMQSGGRIETARALDVATFLIDALHIVHGAGVVHRDLKPDNVYLTPQGRALLLDFGGAKQVAMESDKSMDLMLSNGYAAPEQYQADASKIGPWTDVYACAATLYRMLTGVTPRGAMERYVEDPPLNWSKSTATPAIRRVVERALTLKHTERYPTIREFQQALESAPLPKAGIKRRSLVPTFSVGAVLVGGGVGALAWLFERPVAPPPPVPAPAVQVPTAPAPASVAAPPRTAFPASTSDGSASAERRPTPALAPTRALRPRKAAQSPKPLPSPESPETFPSRPRSESGETIPDQR